MAVQRPLADHAYGKVKPGPLAFFIVCCRCGSQMGRVAWLPTQRVSRPSARAAGEGRVPREPMRWHVIPLSRVASSQRESEPTRMVALDMPGKTVAAGRVKLTCHRCGRDVERTVSGYVRQLDNVRGIVEV